MKCISFVCTVLLVLLLVISTQKKETNKLVHQGGAFSPAAGPFPTVDNGFARSRRKFTRPQFYKQTPENLTARLTPAIRRSYGGRISLNLFGASDLRKHSA